MRDEALLRTQIVPILAHFNANVPDSMFTAVCPADFQRTLDLFAINIPGYGTVTTVLRTPAMINISSDVLKYNVKVCETEADMMLAATKLLRCVLGAPVGDSGQPMMSNIRLCAWNMTSDIWPTLITKWIAYRQICGMPYRTLTADPTMKWFSNSMLLSIDAIYRQGRPTPKEMCEIDGIDALKYLLGPNSVPSLELEGTLQQALVSTPGDAAFMVNSYLLAVAELVFLTCGVKDKEEINNG